MVFPFLRFYLFIQERVCAQLGGGAEEEGEADSPLSAEPHAGLDPRPLTS